MLLLNALEIIKNRKMILIIFLCPFHSLVSVQLWTFPFPEKHSVWSNKYCRLNCWPFPIECWRNIPIVLGIGDMAGCGLLLCLLLLFFGRLLLLHTMLEGKSN